MKLRELLEIVHDKQDCPYHEPKDGRSASKHCPDGLDPDYHIVCRACVLNYADNWIRRNYKRKNGKQCKKK